MRKSGAFRKANKDAEPVLRERTKVRKDGEKISYPKAETGTESAKKSAAKTGAKS